LRRTLFFPARSLRAAMLFALATVTASEATASLEQCAGESAAYDEMRLRTMATKTALELLRGYREALDESYEATRASGYAEAVVDTASLAAGWPLGKAAEEYFWGKAKNTIYEKLIKAGFKSVEKALLKDPTLQSGFETLLKDPTTLSGVSADIQKENFKGIFKNMFGDVGGESLVSVFDLCKFGYERYKGIKQLEAIRAQIRSVDDQLVKLQTREAQQMDILGSSRSALGSCQDRWAQGLPPDPDNRLFKDVTDYLGPEWQSRTRSVASGQGSQAQPEVDSRFVGSWTCPANITIRLNLNRQGAWVDSRGGPEGSMYASGTFPGVWSSSGDTAYLTISIAEYGRRGGTVKLRLIEGKLHDDWGDVYTKD
jgi:hypothetical protein